ncbi:NADP-dependent oxidoreductase [Planotetraspora sp. GP83]|uniref:NADP-dependent oxidoreductase n=1 Tax=Planotetraspora sp. GP83 TaxID=3156264 RepID=UPI003517FA3B
MKALVARSYGPLEDLSIEDIPTPVPGPGQILVRAEAAALNPVDRVLVTGAIRHELPIQHPFVPGVDITGVVEAVGEGVTRFAVGDHVMAWNGVPSGALAEYVLVKDAPSAALRPEGLDAEHGAALPTGGLTASALLDAASPQPGETVLVVGASGGIGSYLVQLAKQAGVTVIATGRADDAEFLKSLGADETIDYKGTDIAEETLRRAHGGVDVVIDLANAGPGLARSAAAARPGGRLVSPLGGPPSFDRGVTATYTGTTTPEGRLDELAAQVVEGRLRVEIGAGYPFAESRQALIDFAAKHVRGKITITF